MSNDTYVVQSGDCLTVIAARKLGSAARYKEIAALNRIPESAILRPGQRLLIPVTKQLGTPVMSASAAAAAASPSPSQQGYSTASRASAVPYAPGVTVTTLPKDSDEFLAMIQKFGDLPAITGPITELLVGKMGVPKNIIEGILGPKRRGARIAQNWTSVIALSFEVLQAHSKGKQWRASGRLVALMCALGEAVPALASPTIRMLKRGKLTAPLGEAYDAAIKLHVAKDFGTLAGFPMLCVEPGSNHIALGKELEGAVANISKALIGNPAAAAQCAPAIAAFVLDLVPDKLKAKLAFRIGAAKVPVAGAVVVAAFEIFNVVLESWDKGQVTVKASNVLALTSAGAGCLPGPGTVISIITDIAATVAAIIEAIMDVAATVQTTTLPNPSTAGFPVIPTHS
jgi:hypothetical protein